MNIKDSLIGKTAKEKHKIKAKALADVGKINFKYKEKDIIIDGICEENDMLKVIIRGAGKKNPFYFKNPPILVPDGTKKKEIIDGEEIEIDNFVENHEEALKTILLQCFDSIKWQPM